LPHTFLLSQDLFKFLRCPDYLGFGIDGREEGGFPIAAAIDLKKLFTPIQPQKSPH
jgi:hypothetical protein